MKRGKTAQNIVESEQAKRIFSEKVKNYFSQLEETTIDIRKEIRLLNNVSGDKVMPINVVSKAEWMSRRKEEEIWKSLEKMNANLRLAENNTNNKDEKSTDNMTMNNEP